MIKTTKVDIAKPNENSIEQWLEITTHVREATNILWRQWLGYHIQQGSGEQLRQDICALKEWIANGGRSTQPRPAPIITAFPNTKWEHSQTSRIYRPRKGWRYPRCKPNLLNDLCHIIANEYPKFDESTLSLIVYRWAKQVMAGRRSTANALPRWASILMFESQIPTFTNSLDVPLQNNGIPFVQKDKELEFQFALKYGGKQLSDKCNLLVNSRRGAGRKVIIQRIINGEYKFLGSSLSKDRSGWSAVVTFVRPLDINVIVDPKKVIHLSPGITYPWLFEIDDKQWWQTSGDGSHVSRMRQRFEAKRISTKAISKLPDRWKEIINVSNDKLVANVIHKCISTRIG